MRVDKATAKYRLIMKGAYEFDGKSINDFLMTGPSRMNKVWDVWPAPGGAYMSWPVM